MSMTFSPNVTNCLSHASDMMTHIRVAMAQLKDCAATKTPVPSQLKLKMQGILQDYKGWKKQTALVTELQNDSPICPMHKKAGAYSPEDIDSMCGIYLYQYHGIEVVNALLTKDRVHCYPIACDPGILGQEPNPWICYPNRQLSQADL